MILQNLVEPFMLLPIFKLEARRQIVQLFLAQSPKTFLPLLQEELGEHDVPIPSPKRIAGGPGWDRVEFATFRVRNSIDGEFLQHESSVFDALGVHSL